MLWHRLALRMGRTVSEVKAVMPIDEFVRWIAFDRISPIGDERLDYMLAQVAYMSVQISGAKKKSGGTFKLEDFLLFKPRPHPAAEFRAAFAHLVKRKDKH